MNANESRQIDGYEYQPFELIFLRRREEILKLVGLNYYALQSMTGLERLVTVMKEPADRIEHAREIETLAQAEVKADFPLLHSAAAVLIWGALEAAFRDFFVRWLVTHPSSLSVPEFKNIRVRVAEYESFEGEDRMRFLAGVLEREFAASLKPGVGRFECLLRPLGIVPNVSKDVRRNLSELASVRNVIVHRASVADSRLLELCPWLGLKQGDLIIIGRTTFDRYERAASEYAAAVIDAAHNVSKTMPAMAPQPSVAPSGGLGK